MRKVWKAVGGWKSIFWLIVGTSIGTFVLCEPCVSQWYYDIL